MIKAVSGDLTAGFGIDDRHYEVNIIWLELLEPTSFDPVLVNGKIELTLRQ